MGLLCGLGLITAPLLAIRFFSITISDFLFIAAFLVSFFFHIERNRSLRDNYLLPLILITIGIISSSYVSDYKLQSFLVGLKLLIVLYILPVTILNSFQIGFSIDKLNVFLSIGYLLFSLSVIVEKFLHISVGSNESDRYMGLAQHVTDAGGISACGLALTLSLVSTRHMTKLRSFQIALFPLLLVSLLLSGSVSGYISAGISLLSILFSYSRIKFRSKIQITVIATIVLVYLSKYHFYDPISRISKATTGRYDTASSRISNWKSSWDSITGSLSNFLLGHGLDLESGKVTNRFGEILSPHNLILQVWLQGGTILMIGIVWMIIKSLKVVKTLAADFGLNYFPWWICSVTFSMTSPLMFTRYIWLPILIPSVVYYELRNQRGPYFNI